MDIEYGGIGGDLALTQLGLMVSVPFIILLGLYMGFAYLFGNNKEDFIESKSKGYDIVCQGLIKTYTYKSDEYELSDETIVIKKLFKNKSFYFGDCDIQD